MLAKPDFGSRGLSVLTDLLKVFEDILLPNLGLSGRLELDMRGLDASGDSP